MNYLAHLYLAERTGTSFAGNFLGDFVRGRLDDRFDPGLTRGLRLHRRVDAYSDSHPETMAARRLFSPPYRRYAGIMLDVYFDHLLLRHWERFHGERPAAFVERAVQAMRRDWPSWAPFAAARLGGLPAILLSYRYRDGLETALRRIDARFSRPTPLPNALPTLIARDADLEHAFLAFFPALVRFSLETAAEYH